jgi:hypothetical protein
MQRKEVLKKFTSLLGPDELVIFIGEKLCAEAYLNDKENYIYMMNNYFISLAVGVALAVPDCTRVFVIFDDKTLIEDFSTMFQVFLSKNINLFLVFFYSKEELFKKISHAQGVFFDIGIQSFIVENYFNSVEGLKKLKIFLKEMKGPKIYSMEVDVGTRSKSLSIDKTPVFFRDRFNFVINKLIGDCS